MGKCLGELIKTHRESQNMTLRDLGEQIGRSKGTVYDWQRGRGGPQGLDDLKHLALALKLPVYYLATAMLLDQKPWQDARTNDVMEAMKVLHPVSVREVQVISMDALSKMVMADFTIQGFVPSESGVRITYCKPCLGAVEFCFDGFLSVVINGESSRYHLHDWCKALESDILGMG